MEPDEFGLFIARHREERGLSQSALAREVGISRPYLTQIETGKRTASDETAKRLLEALGIPIDQVLQELLQGQLPDDQLASFVRVAKGAEVLSTYLTPEQTAEVMEAMGSMDNIEAAMKNLAVQPMPPAPDGWLDLSKEDRRLVQRIINRLIAARKDT
jgi:transcriptional regulator with XRE-family HTH domain